jgi:hypothetical protein
MTKKKLKYESIEWSQKISNKDKNQIGKMEKIKLDLVANVQRTDEEGIILAKVTTGEIMERYVEISWAAYESLQDSPGHEYKVNEEGVPELYYTSPQSGVLLPLEIGGKIVSFKFA